MLSNSIPDLSCLVSNNENKINEINSAFSKEIKNLKAKEEALDYFVSTISHQYPDMDFFEAWNLYKKENSIG